MRGRKREERKEGMRVEREEEESKVGNKREMKRKGVRK
jgi:hypothetical protein